MAEIALRAQPETGRAATRVPTGVVVIVLALLTVLLCLVSLAVGSQSLTLEELVSAFVPGERTVASIIVWQLRMPRTVLAAMVGAALAVAGVVMQGLTRNPLAEPGILGVNAGASLSVVLSMSLLGLTDVGDFLWFAFAGAALAALLVHLMSVRSADAGPARLVRHRRTVSTARTRTTTPVGTLVAARPVSGCARRAISATSPPFPLDDS